MIVRYESDGSIVMITQNDHAQLSGLFAAHWGNEKFEKPRPYLSLLRAAMFHDRGWIRYETSPQLNLETGRTPNYREVPNDKTQLEAFEWAGDWLSAIDPYAGLMITKHRSGLWQGRYGVTISAHDPARHAAPSDPRVHRQERGQAEGRGRESRRQGARDQLQPAPGLGYDVSLHLQHRGAQAGQDRARANVLFRRGGRRHDADAVEANTIALDPYPFDQPSLTTNVIFRRLPQTKFKDSTELQTVYFKTAPQIASFKLIPAAAR